MSMFYLLLALPHVIALGGLFAFAFRVQTRDPTNAGEEGDEGGNDGGQRLPPRTPRPDPSGGGLPLPDASPPRRRLRDGEALAELHPWPSRREHAPSAPSRTPARRPL